MSLPGNATCVTRRSFRRRRTLKHGLLMRERKHRWLGRMIEGVVTVEAGAVQRRPSFSSCQAHVTGFVLIGGNDTEAPKCHCRSLRSKSCRRQERRPQPLYTAFTVLRLSHWSCSIIFTLVSKVHKAVEHHRSSTLPEQSLELPPPSPHLSPSTLYNTNIQTK